MIEGGGLEDRYVTQVNVQPLLNLLYYKNLILPLSRGT